jgi:hypothetical protein
MNKKKVILIMVLVVAAAIVAYFFNFTNKSYDIDAPMNKYGFTSSNVSGAYLDSIKKNIYPEKIRKYIVNEYVPTSILRDDATGNEVVELMKLIGYEQMFKSLFDKNRSNFDDCPVTEKFKSKFNANLITFFNIEEKEKADVDCKLNVDKKEFEIEIQSFDGYSANLEPNYFRTYHFGYAHDADGNIDDIFLKPIN